MLILLEKPVGISIGNKLNLQISLERIHFFVLLSLTVPT